MKARLELFVLFLRFGFVPSPGRLANLAELAELAPKYDR
jgi:hypothetical protein